MIEARKRSCFESVFYRLLKWQMRRKFHGVYVSGLERIGCLDPGRSVVACANHTNWWDGFVIELLTREFPGREFYLAQEEKHLARYRWLRWLGVFGIDLDVSALPGIRYALTLLKNPRNVVWLFPQGRIEHPTRPILLKPGALFLAEKTNAQILPVIIKYEWMIESRPSVFVEIGEPGNTDLEGLARAIPIEREQLLQRFRPLFKPGISLNKWVDYLKWLFSERSRPFERENR